MRPFILVLLLACCPLLNAATFRAAGSYPVRDGSLGLAVADVNRDGKPDVVTADNSNVVSIWLGDGKGALTFKAQYPVAAQPWSVRVADLNGDGNPDIVCTYLPDMVAIFLGNGDGTFRTGAQYQVKAFAHIAAVADLNKDGILDIVVPCGAYASVAVLLGNGDGTFRLPQYFQTGVSPLTVVVADFNRDGVVDLAVGCEAGAGPAGNAIHEVSILLGGGAGSFSIASTIQVPSGPGALAVADLDGDGRPDLVAQGFYGERVTVLWNTASGVFQLYEHPQAQTSAFFPTIADVDGDGKPDILTAGPGGLNVYVNAGGRTFLPPVIYPGVFANAATGDFNGDGKLDVVTTNQGSGMTLRLNAPSQYTARAFADRSSAVYGERVTLGWQLIPAEASFSGPTGTVTWTTGLIALGTANIAPSGPNLWSASFPALLPAAVHNITSQFTGDGIVASPAPVAVRVDRAPTAITPAVTTAAPSFDQPLRVSAKVASLPTPPSQPTGTIQWREGSRGLASVVMDSTSQAVAEINGLAAGIHVIQVGYSGDANYVSSSENLTVTIRPADISISLACLPNPAGEGETVRCSARGTDIRATGRVSIREGTTILNSAALTGGGVDLALTALSRGTHILTAAYAGDANFSPAESSSLAADIFGALAAKLATHDSPAVAPQSIASIYGAGFSGDLIQAGEGPLPEALGGVRVTLIDSTGERRPALLHLVSAARINILVPDAIAGAGRVEVTSDSGDGWSGSVEIRNVAPGLFAANGDGKGVAAANVTTVAPDGAQSSSAAFRCGDPAEPCVAVPIDLGDGASQSYLNLFGTGFRSATVRKITVAGTEAEIVYWGEQAQQPGRDRIDVRLPAELKGRGTVEIAGEADGIPFNPLLVEIK